MAMKSSANGVELENIKKKKKRGGWLFVHWSFYSCQITKWNLNLDLF